MDTATRLAMLEAREALLDVLHSYAQAWDTREPQLLRAALHDDVVLDLGSRRGVLRGLDAVIAAAQDVWAGAVSLHHWMSDPLLQIDLDAGTASGSAALDCMCTYLETGTAHIAGRYEDVYRRVDGVWGISVRRYELQRLTPLARWQPVQGTDAAVAAG
jgi:hypothetical protein